MTCDESLNKINKIYATKEKTQNSECGLCELR